MLKLFFNPSMIPRTILRKEWYDIWRWKRTVEKQLAKDAEEARNNLITYGNTMPKYIKDDLINKMINPPLLLGPYMDKSK